MAVEFIDNSKPALDLMAGNIKRALTAMGIMGLEVIHDTMDIGYGKRIYKTGMLHRDQKYRVDEQGQSTSWGVLRGDLSAPYAAYVHEGTSRMKGRPFLRDAIMGYKDMLLDVAREELKKGF